MPGAVEPGYPRISRAIITPETTVGTALVLALGQEPVDDLLAPIDGLRRRYPRNRDCVAPRTVEEAVLDGLRVGAAV